MLKSIDSLFLPNRQVERTKFEDDGSILAAFENLLASTAWKTVRSRHCSLLRACAHGRFAVVEAVERRGHAIGCRVLAAGMACVEEITNGSAMPDTILFTSRGGVELRGQLMPHLLVEPQSRQKLAANHEHRVIAAVENEDFRDFEERVVDVLESELADFSRVNPSALTYPETRAKPDGLFWNSHQNKLLIVEVKKGRLSFDEGMSQIAQYRAFASYQPKYGNASIRTLLITQSATQTADYGAWLNILNSENTYRFWAGTGDSVHKV